MKQKKQKTLLRSFRLFIICLFTLGLANNIEAQNINLSGTVLDDESVPLTGASIIVKGTSKGATADFDGNFKLNDVGSNEILVVSYIGYKTKEISINGQSSINIILEQDLASLDEVVIVGYGAQKKSQLTGAVATVSTSELTKSVSASVDNALQGKVAGVSVSTNNATPGGGVSVRIRGAGGLNNSEPLYVVDGVILVSNGNENTSPLSSINSKDIKSISILKDAASAAIYGARAANGVVLITTKRGKGTKSTITVNSSYGVQNMINDYDVMNAETYATFINEAKINAGQSPEADFSNPSSFGVGTDWVDTITQSASIADHNISFSSGNEKGNMFMSLGYYDQEGIVKGSSFQRISFTANGDMKLTDKLKVGSSISLSGSKQNLYSNRRGNGNPIFDTAIFYPTIPVFDNEGNYSPTPQNGFYKPKANPLFQVEGPTTPRKVKNLRGNLYAQYTLAKNLNFKTSASYTYGNVTDEDFGRVYDLGAAVSTDQSIRKFQSAASTFLIENTLNYNYITSDHTVGVTLGQSAEEFKSESLVADGLYPEEGNVVIDEFAESLNLENVIQEYSMNSYFGRINYGYKGKYLLTGNIRYDGSSRFGSNNKWGLFPAISGAWNISNEDFFPKDGAINILKFRTGWGQVGSNEIGNYLTSSAVLRNFGYGFGNSGTLSVGSASTSIANPDLQWETVTQYSFGVDAELFDRKLSLVAEYYNKEHSDMLLAVPQSAVTGLSNTRNQGSITQNIAELTNKGFEFSADYSSKIGEDLSFSIGANITTITNEVTKLGPSGKLFGGNVGGRGNQTLTQVGREMGEFYGWIADGIFQNDTEVSDHATQNVNTAPGDIRFRDINGDNVINDDDKTFIGNPIPDFVYGFNINLDYKGFDFSIQANGTQGNDILNLTKRALIDNTSSENKLNFTPWSSTNSNSTYPRAHVQDPNTNIRTSSYFVEDGSFMRIKVIQLGYTLKSKLLDKLNMSNLRIYTNIQNPFTFTNYSGIDPEVGNANGNNLSAGIDYFVYPMSRSLSIGLNATF